MQNYLASDFCKVYLADGEVLDIIPNKNVWTLNKVRHIYELKKKLISLGLFDDGGH